MSRPDSCLEHCQGSIMSAQKLATLRNDQDLAIFLSDYENYKNPDSANITYPIGMRGRYFRDFELR